MYICHFMLDADQVSSGNTATTDWKNDKFSIDLHMSHRWILTMNDLQGNLYIDGL